ncbi:hypothetical protein KK488_06800 [Sphingobium sp. H33]|uniref:PepSY domain-containing protein n=2 Tax=Sphingobium nicotianae TaxID=2782607 RepID=A0A9X1DAV4_9SPHN|nr:hypothetical protein [Sphingobium nicotianae]
MWFASGLVMIYVPYPSLSRAERLAHVQPIDWRRVTLMPPTGPNGPPRALALEMRDAVPVWRIEHADGERETLAAAPGTLPPPVTAAYAARVASRFGGAPVGRVERIERDQWTVAGGFDRHRPLWKAALADRAGTELYVSASTGGVVQSTTRTARFWNWLGSVPHWIYPTILRQDNAAWRGVVMWVSGPCIAAAITGIWIGILRTRIGKRRFKGGRMVPYHGWMLWHHVAGLVGGLFLLTWIFSGWLSVDPGRLFTSPDPDPQAEAQYVAGAQLPAIDLVRLGQVGTGARLVEVSAFAGQALVALSDGEGKRRILSATTLAPARADRTVIEQAARRLVPDGRLVRSDLLTAPDLYWYGLGDLPALPMLRLQFDDPARTWLHIDPATGALYERLDARRRAYRWCYDMLHKWDLNALMLHRPLWDLWLWTFSILGLVTSISGVWIGWKRLVHRPR